MLSYPYHTWFLPCETRHESGTYCAAAIPRILVLVILLLSATTYVILTTVTAQSIKVLKYLAQHLCLGPFPAPPGYMSVHLAPYS